MEKRDSDIGDRIREAREYVGLTQQQVADAIALPRSAVSDIERGKRKLTTDELKSLSFVLKHPASFFLGDESEAELDIVVLARTAQSLTDNDRQELIRFAKFLEYQNSTKKRGET